MIYLRLLAGRIGYAEFRTTIWVPVGDVSEANGGFETTNAVETYTLTQTQA